MGVVNISLWCIWKQIQQNTVNVQMNANDANFQTKQSAFIFTNTILLQMWSEDFKGFCPFHH